MPRAHVRRPLVPALVLGLAVGCGGSRPPAEPGAGGSPAPAPTAPVPPAAPAAAVPAKPAGPPWARWPMPNARLPGLPHPHDYDLATSGVVRDRVTGLMWQRSAPNQFFTFVDAGRHCAESRLAGYADWRVPSRIELVSLLDTTRIQPSIDVQAFPDTANDWFWTSTRSATDPTTAWYVYFYFGYPKTDDAGSQFSVRCVRSAAVPAAPATRYRIDAHEVLDLATGLHWQRAASPKTMTFDGARTSCGRLFLDGARGWRVPTLGELLTLIDERAASPMIDRNAFPDTPAEPFWSSSTFANGHELAWYVRFDQGSGLYGRLTETFRARCVR